MIAACQRADIGRFTALAASIATLLAGLGKAHAQFDISTGVGSTTQNFDTLAASGTGVEWTNDLTLDGWFLFNFTNTAIAAYNAGNGGSNAGSFYSFGTDAATERAFGGTASGGTYFGSPASGAVAGYIAFAATNTSAATLSSFTLGFDGEQWRNGGNTTAQSMVLEYGFGSTFNTVTWNAPGGNFDWASPVATSSAAAVDGNAAGLVTGRGGSITGLTWTTGQTLWIRWIERNDFGNDHGLAIDNFAFSWSGSVIIPQYWDTNGSTAGIGGTGAWSTGSLTWNPQANGQGTPQAADPNGQLIFGGTAGTVTIDAAGVTTNGALRFETSGYTIAASGAGKLTLSTSGTIEVPTGVSNTNITAPISGSAGIIKTGDGSLQLSGANDFSGEISLNGGSIAFDQDVRLGNAANAVVLRGGTLAPSATVALAATRNVSGAGTILVKSGQILTINGNATFGNMILAGDDPTHATAGELNLSGTINSFGAITFNDPMSIAVPNGVNLTGDITMPNVTGAIRITGQPTLGGSGGVRKFTVGDTPQDIDFLFDGGVTGSSRLYKVGEGTMKLQGSNTAAFTGGVRLGTAGTSPEPGGRLIIDDLNDLGSGATQQIQFNDGRLHSLSDLTGVNALPVGVSLGAGQLSPAIFSGSPMEFTGAFQLFKPNNSSFIHRVELETNVTIGGGFDKAGDTDTIPEGVLFTGSGSATFNALSNSAIEPIQIDGPNVSINGILSDQNAAVSVHRGRFGGNATLAGGLTVGDSSATEDATLSPGNGIGTMSIVSATFNSDAIFKLEINSSLTTPAADQLIFSGTLALGAGIVRLDASDLGNATLSQPLSLVIIDNTSGMTWPQADAFEGLPDGGTLLIGSNLFQIDYTFGPNSNDVALILIPEPTALSAFILGTALLGLRRRRAGGT